MWDTFFKENQEIPGKDELDKIFEISLTILFRLLFAIAYAEDRNLLPYKTNQEYKRNSLQSYY